MSTSGMHRRPFEDRHLVNNKNKGPIINTNKGLEKNYLKIKFQSNDDQILEQVSRSNFRLSNFVCDDQILEQVSKQKFYIY